MLWFSIGDYATAQNGITAVAWAVTSLPYVKGHFKTVEEQALKVIISEVKTALIKEQEQEYFTQSKASFSPHSSAGDLLTSVTAVLGPACSAQTPLS